MLTRKSVLRLASNNDNSIAREVAAYRLPCISQRCEKENEKYFFCNSAPGIFCLQDKTQRGAVSGVNVLSATCLASGALGEFRILKSRDTLAGLYKKQRN